MGDERAGAPDNPSPEQQQRLEAARSLLERNGELVFKLNGLAALRRTSGGRPPSAEERALLAQAQRSLQDAASLLPPQILVPAATTKQLRRQLESAAAAASGEPGCHKRRLIITHIKEGQADGRQAAMDGLHLEDALARAAQGDHREEDMEQLEGMLFPSHAQPALEGQQGQRLAGDAPPPPPPQQQQQQSQQQQSQQQQSQQQQQQSQQQQQQQQQQHSQQQRQDQAAEGSSGAPPEGALSLSALAGSPQQQPTGGMLSQAFLHGLRPQSSLGDLVGGGGSARLSADLGLLPVAALNGGLGSMGMGAGQQAQPRPGASLLGGERLAGEDAYLLSKAYSSMSTEQKERLAAQPPEVRHFVLRERMRRTKQQLAQMQAQPAAGSGATTPPAPPSRPASGPSGVQGAQWEGMQPVGQPQDWAPGAYQSTSPAPPPGEQQGSGVQQQQQRPFSWQQQAQMQQQQAQQPSASPQPDQGFTADSQLLQQEQQQQQQQQRGLPLGLASLRQLSPAGLAGLQQMGAQLPGGLSGLGALLRGSLAGGASEAAAAGPGADGGPFVALNEEQRLEHLRSLKRRQEEWLEQQRLAAARLAQPGSG